jgi:amino acid adenylation domain-containing protein/non-ribosomal peptide synthase protein (TIGR01720 family)
MVSDLYVKLKALNIKATVAEGKLNLQAPKGALTPVLVEEIKLHKAELIQLIDQYRQKREVFDHIENVPLQDSYPLSSSQYRLWILSQFGEGNVAYNVPGVYFFEGDLDKSALEQALQTMITRHESLRTVFKERADGEVRQMVQHPKDMNFRITEQDLSHESDPVESLEALLREEAFKPFDLMTGPLFRISLFQLEKQKWVFSYVIHHITIDAWSMDIFIKELMQLYNAYSLGANDPLVPLRIQYKDYVAWQQEQLSSDSFGKHRDYWLQQLAGTLPVLDLQGDKSRPALQTYNGASFTHRIDPVVTREVKALINEQGGTLFIGLLAMVHALLYRYAGQRDIIIGTPVAGRVHADLEDQIGYYGNTLAIRTKFSGADSYLQVLNKAKQVVLEAFEHQVYPFDLLVEELQLQRDMSRNPLFDVQVIVGQENRMGKQQSLGNIRVSEYKKELKTSRFDVVFNFAEDRDALLLQVQYNNDIYSKESIQRIVAHLQQLMRAVTDGPDVPIRALNILSSEDEHQLLVSFNEKQFAYNHEHTILDLFAMQVAKQPDAVAVFFENEKLTYRELEQKADQLAHYLLSHHQVQPEEPVGIMVDRSEKMVIGILGILKAGGAYVPIDPEYPTARKAYIVKDTAIKLLLTQTDYLYDINYYEGAVFAMDVQLETLEDCTGGPALRIHPDQLAYVIYTSGSTGQPKGVMIPHASLMHATSARLNVYEDVTAFLLLSSISFDSSVAGIFGTLCSGGILAVTRKADVADISSVAAFIAEHEISHLLTVPSYYKLLLAELERKANKLKQVIVAGEVCPISLVEHHFASTTLQHCDFFNEYGPTECAVWSTFYKYDRRKEPVATIGRPIANAQVYILDQDGNLAPVGVTGELFIGGGGLARGYLNQPALTSEKFVPHPFKKGALLYKTGDMGKWLPDGNIAFLGRKDDQVKINGYRIEPGEVEAALLKHPDVDEVIVMAKELGAANLELVAYLSGAATLDSGVLQAHLNKFLPLYAVPSHFVQLKQLPRTPNGKVNKEALPHPAGAAMKTGVSYVAASLEMERELVSVLEEVFRKQPIGIADDFFMIGGDSIKSIQIASRLKQRGYTLTIQDILLYPVIKDMAERITVSVRTIDQGLVEGRLGLTPIHAAFFSEKWNQKHHYNQSVLLCSKKSLSEKGLRVALDKLVLHHDGLRMVFHKDGDTWTPENLGKAQSYGWEVIDDVTETSFIAHCERIQSSMDLEQGPLFKAVLFRGAEQDRLLLVAHHLIIDGVSWRILFEDLSQLYMQYTMGVSLSLPSKTDSFKYWYEKLSEYALSAALQQEDAYWSVIENAGNSPLPLDHTAGSNLSGDATVVSFALDEEMTARLLTQTYQAYRTDINDILITALGLALHEVFDLQQMMLQLEGHGRENIGAEVDVSRTVGWFTILYPVLIDLQQTDAVRQLIAVKEALHRVPNKGIGYGALKYLAGKPYAAAPPVSFNYLGDFGSGVDGGNGEQLFEFSGEYKGKEMPDDMPRTTVLDASGIVISGQMRLSITYSRAQYDAATIDHLLATWQQLLEELTLLLAGEEQGQLTPIDLTYKGLSVEELQQMIIFYSRVK